MHTVLVIAPHPDDEALGCGGTICLHRKRGDRVHAILLTSGERGIPGVIEDAARAIREAEARRAAEVLGIEPPVFLRLPDLALAEHTPQGVDVLRTQLA